jgi:hypothetical protein
LAKFSKVTLGNLGPYFRARKAQGKTYSRKQFSIELPAAAAVASDS